MTVGAVTSSGTVIASTVQAGTFGNTGAAHIGASATLTGTIIATTLNAGTIGNTGALLTGTLQTASQTNITGVGTVTTGTWSASFGAVSGANLTSLTAGNLSGTIPSAVLANSTHYIGTTAIALNRGTGSQTLTGVSVDGNAATVGGFTPTATAGTANRVVVADANGYITNNYFHTTGGGSERNASGLGYFAGHNTSDYYIRSYTAAAAAALLSGQTMNIAGSATTAGTVTTAAQPNITSLGTLTGLTTSGTLKRSAAGVGYLDGQYASVETSATTGPIYTIGGSYVPTSTTLNTMYGVGYTYTGVGQFAIASTTGAPSNHWGLYVCSSGTPRIFLDSDNGTAYVTANKALYADLAEKYSSDLDYPPGTVVVFGGEKEITISTTSYDTAVAGVISTNPGYSMNTLAEGLEVALTGRVPCQVQGPVRKGQLVVTSDTPGVAQAIDNSKFLPGCVIGKALETINTNTIETIEVVVGRF